MRVLIEWAGDDPDREGLVDTPGSRRALLRAVVQRLQGRSAHYLERTFQETGGYDELIVLSNVRVVSFCEHHMLPVVGKAHVGYLPRDRVVGISKLARVVQGFSRRLQIQEKLTSDIAEAIQEILNPVGVGVVIEAEHSCMTLRGVNTPGVRAIDQPIARRDPRRPAHARGVFARRRRPSKTFLSGRSSRLAVRLKSTTIWTRPVVGKRGPGPCPRGCVSRLRHRFIRRDDRGRKLSDAEFAEVRRRSGVSRCRARSGRRSRSRPQVARGAGQFAISAAAC